MFDTGPATKLWSYKVQNKFFIFKFTVVNSTGEKEQYIIDFVYSDRWKREIMIRQLVRLFPDAKKFTLFDGFSEMEWDNTPKDIEEMIKKIELVEPKDQDDISSTPTQESSKSKKEIK